MKICQLIKKLIFAGLLATLTGCSDGGGDNAPTTTPTDPNQEFSLSTFKSTNPGIVYSTQLTGSDSDGGQWTGSLSIVNRAQEMFGALLVTPQEVLIDLSYEGNSAASGARSYIDMSGYLIGRKKHGTLCAAPFPYQLPDSVKIGDRGLAPTETCSDNTTSDSNWRVEDAGNGNINLITSTAIKGGTSSAGDTAVTLDSAGNILAYKLVLSGSDIPTVTLRSK